MIWDLSWAFIALLDEPDIREFAKSLAPLKLDVELCCLFFSFRGVYVGEWRTGSGGRGLTMCEALR